MKKFLLISFLIGFLTLPLLGLADVPLQKAPTTSILGEGGVFDRITDLLFTVLIFVAVIFIIIAGYNFITAYGDPAKFTKARDFVIYALIGVLVAFSAKGIVKLIETVLTSEATIEEEVNSPWLEI